MSKEDKSRLCGMTQEEVDSYLKEKNISVSVMMEHGYNKDDDWAEIITDDEGYQTGFGDDCVRIEKMWGFSSPNGFHTFSWEEPKMTEVKAQYMTVLFHKLQEEYDVSWNSAEALSLAYVMSEFQVPYVEREWEKAPDMSTEEGQEEVRNKLLDAIKSGNVVVPKAVEESRHGCFVTGQVIAEGDKARFSQQFDAWVSEEGQKIIREQVDSGNIDSIEEWSIIWGEWFAEEEAWESERKANLDQDAGIYLEEIEEFKNE